MKSIFIVAISILTLLTSCASTAKIVNSWYDPTLTVDTRQVHKILVSALVENEGRRRAIEDNLVEVLKGKGVASYKVFLDPSTLDENAMKEKLNKDGYDGVLVMRLVNVSKETEYIPGSYNTYPSYFGYYWGYYYNSWNTWNMYQEQGHYVENQNYLIETNLYSLKNGGKLVWNGITSSINPTNLSSLIDQIVGSIHKKMEEQGFIVHEK